MAIFNIVNIVSNENEIYFITEPYGLLGKIDINTGKVNFILDYNDTEKDLLFTEMTLWYDKLFLISDSGKALVYNLMTKKTEVLADIQKTDGFDFSKGWSGKGMVGGKHYFFLCDCLKSVYMDELGRVEGDKGFCVNEDVIWSYADQYHLCALSMDNKIIHVFDMGSGIKNDFETHFYEYSGKSRNVLDVQGLICDDEYAYYHDSVNIVRIDISNGETSLFYKSQTEDNGNRLSLINGNILIPPWEGDTFTIISRDDGEIINNIKVPEAIYQKRSGLENGYSLTGKPCGNDEAIFYPLISMDAFVRFDKSSNAFSFINLEYDEKELNILRKNIVHEKQVLPESNFIGLKDYVCMI